MKFRKEIIIFSLIILFMLMSAVSAEENITVDDGADSTSDYIELESDQGYIENNISENPILDDDVMDDDNSSEEDVEQDACTGSFDKHGAYLDYGFNGASYAKTSSIKNFAVHKSSPCSYYSKGDDADVRDNENSIDAMLSNFQSPDVMDFEALNDIINDIHTEDLFEETYSSYRQYFDYLIFDSLRNLIEENNIGDVFNDEMELFMESDSNISDMLIIQDDMTLMNQTFDLNTMPDDCINSFEMESDMQLSDDVGCWRDSQDDSDKTVAMQSFKFSQQINCLSSIMSENIQPTFYHMIGCECTNTSFTKQYSYENLPKVSEFDTITYAEEDNHDYVLFKKYNVNSPFIVENTSIFVLFGVIEIKIP